MSAARFRVGDRLLYTGGGSAVAVRVGRVWLAGGGEPLYWVESAGGWFVAGESCLSEVAPRAGWGGRGPFAAAGRVAAEFEAACESMFDPDYSLAFAGVNGGDEGGV